MGTCLCENNNQLCFYQQSKMRPVHLCCLLSLFENRTDENKEGFNRGRRPPFLLWGRIHFVRRFGFKSVGTNLWHEVILCWSFSPKFIHQLFTVNADCISVGNYKGWVFSLRQKECDTAEPTPNLMRQRRCPSGIREERIIYVLETVCSGEGKKSRHIILNLS